MEITDFSMDYFSLKGKNAIITGGNRGLGQAFTVALAKAGANVLVPSIDSSGDEDTRRLVAETGSKSVFMQIDITRDGAPKEIVENCVNELGSVDILVNNAGICLCGDFPDFTREQWDKMIAVNLTAAFELSNTAGKYMKEQKSGKIINICSMFSFLGGRQSPAYGVTKHGIAGLTKVYCDELGEYNVQSNGIAPGYFKTEVTKARQADPKGNQWVMDHAPVNRWGDVAELMGACVFLASKASDFINGVILPVDGGFLVR
ncbi:MAG: SDR family oxidoreductase [Spirochaetes bacterium]|nr:SDR family oxidoreductase [Spirochaetota bacterium]